MTYVPGSGGGSGGTPAVVLGTAAAAGVAATFLRDDDTVVAFDATTPTASAVGDAAAVGIVALAARRDHLHGREAFVAPAIVLGTAAAAGVATTPIRSDATVAAFDATVPTTSAVGAAAAAGTVALAARRDHTHGREAFATPAVALGSAAAAGAATTLIRSDATIAAFDATTPAAIAAAGAVGTAAFAPRRDHVHSHPVLTTGLLHTDYLPLTGGTVSGNLTTGGATGLKLTNAAAIVDLSGPNYAIIVGGFFGTYIKNLANNANNLWCDDSGNVNTRGTLGIGSRPAFVAADKYLVVDANGNVHVSALGPAS